MVKYTGIARLAFFASFFALGVIALGAFTRLIDAGLGCPDWPGCYGHFTVIGAENAGTHLVAYKAWSEMIHRYFVGGLSLFILAIVGNVFVRKNTGKLNKILGIVLIALLVYQIRLGQWTVTLKLIPIIVSQHLIGGFLILSTLWLVYLNNKNTTLLTQNKLQHSGTILFFASVGLIILFTQIMLGAWTSTNYASLSCPGFPFCMNQQSIVWHLREAFTVSSTLGINYEGGVLPESIRQTIQMSHRFGAFVLTAYLLVLMMFSMPKLQRSPDIAKIFYVIFGLLCVQLCLGISNVVFKLPVVTAVSHTVMAALLLISMITLIFKLAVNRGAV